MNKGLMASVLASVLALGLMGASVQAQQLTDLRRGFTLFQLERYDDAAKAWQQDAKDFISESTSLENQRAAGLANVMATIAYEQANDDRAYQTWAEAVRHFLYGNTRWTDERVALKALYEEQVQELAIPEPVIDPAINPEDIPNQDANLIDIEPESLVLDDNVLFFLEVELALAVSEYDGPTPGLQKQRSYSLTNAAVEQAEAIDDGKVFISRPSFYANRRPENLSETVIAQRPAPRIKVDEDAIRRDSQYVGSRAMFYVSQPEAEQSTRNFASAPLVTNSRSNLNRDERNQYRRSQPRIVASTIARQNAQALARAQAQTNADENASLFIPHRGMGQLTRAIAQNNPPQQPILLAEQIALEEGLDINELPATAASQALKPTPEAKPIRVAIKPTQTKHSREPSYTPDQSDALVKDALVKDALVKQRQHNEAVTHPLISEVPKLIKQLQTNKLEPKQSPPHTVTKSDSKSKLEDALAASENHKKIQENVSLTGRNIELDLALMPTKQKAATSQAKVKSRTTKQPPAARSSSAKKLAIQTQEAKQIAPLNKPENDKPKAQNHAAVTDSTKKSTKKTRIESAQTTASKPEPADNKIEKKTAAANTSKKIKTEDSNKIKSTKSAPIKSITTHSSKLSLLSDAKNNKENQTRFVTLSGKEKAEVERKKKVLKALDWAQGLQTQPEHLVDVFYIPAIAHRSGFQLNSEQTPDFQEVEDSTIEELRNDEEYDRFIASQDEFEFPDYGTFVVHSERSIVHLHHDKDEQSTGFEEEYAMIDYDASDFRLAFVHAQCFFIDDTNISLAANYQIETTNTIDSIVAVNQPSSRNKNANNLSLEPVEQFDFAPLFLEALTTPTASGSDTSDLNDQR